MRFLRGILATGVAAVVFLVAPALAEWPEQGRREFNANCVPSCQAQAQGRNLADKCPGYCRCMARELESAYPDPNAFVRLHQSQDPAYMQRVQDLAQMCLSRELR